MILEYKLFGIYEMVFAWRTTSLCITYIFEIHTLPTNDEYEIILLQRISSN